MGFEKEITIPRGNIDKLGKSILECILSTLGRFDKVDVNNIGCSAKDIDKIDVNIEEKFNNKIELIVDEIIEYIIDEFNIGDNLEAINENILFLKNLFIERFRNVYKVGEIKKMYNKPPLQPNRWQKVLNDALIFVGEFLSESGVNSKGFKGGLLVGFHRQKIKKIYNFMHDKAIELEKIKIGQ